MKKTILLLTTMCIHCASIFTLQAGEICLNGLWDYGFERHYSGIGNVPGLHTDPTTPGDGTLWYIISQLITDWRLNRNRRCRSVEGYGIRYDEAAVQTVLNILATASCTSEVPDSAHISTLKSE